MKQKAEILQYMAAKKDKIKSLTSKEQINREVKFLRDNNIFHKFIISNYTTTIETKSKIIKFNDNLMSQKAFIAYQMIKRDLKNYTANEMPVIDKNELQYFETFLDKPLTANKAYLVDIKSAYATILFNDGFISKETFAYINILPKKARLAAVGMLASRKDYFYFHGAELTGHEKQINELENYFWYCVKRTAEIMQEIRQKTNPLFFWVDGIYFTEKKDAETAKKILKENKYFYSEKNIYYFLCAQKETERGDIINQISFYQTSENIPIASVSKKNTEYKVFSIPVKKFIKEKLIKYLTKLK